MGLDATGLERAVNAVTEASVRRAARAVFGPGRGAAVVIVPRKPGDESPPKKKAGRPGEVVTPAAKGERIKDRLRVNDPAPDFTLAELTGERTTTLSSFRGKRPVVLVFA